MVKKDLRKKLIEVRKKIKSKDEKSKIIVDKIINMDIYKKVNVIALYKALPNEVNLDLLISKSLKDNKTVLLPRIENGEMVFIRIDEKTKYTKSNYGVSEPIFDIKRVYRHNIPLIIVPGLGFDNKMNRIGYGKGYYDKYLRKNNGYKIGVCFTKQIVENVPVDENDVKMDLIVNEK